MRLPQELKDSVDAKRAEEECRKRLFYDECFEGPFEVCGQEHRRIVGAHATHQTHSVPGSGRVNNLQGTQGAVGRALSGCAVCARSMWLEDLHDMDLFAKPASEEAEGAVEDDANGADADAASAEIGEAKPRFAVQPQCAAKVNKLLCSRAYSRRWPRIPKHVLWASSVQHPHMPQWRWLLHTRRVGDLHPEPQMVPLVR